MSVDPLNRELQILLYRYAETAWQEVVRPWLVGTRGQLSRSYVVVPTRGQAYGLKLRCLMENVPLLGVEFLTPGLARKKWLPLHLQENAETAQPTAGREVLLLGLRVLIERKLEPLVAEDPQWGFWKSLQSDPERVLDDFDELLKAGFRERDFGLDPLREIFGELIAWLTRLGYELAPLQSEAAALSLLPPSATQIGGRLLIYGLSAEFWTEFSNVAALARRFADLTVVLPEPEFRGRKQLDENWVEMWEALLGANALAIAPGPEFPTCERVGALWRTGAKNDGVADNSLPCRVVVGCTRRDEMALIVEEIEGALSRGAEHIGVIFPSADAAHSMLGNLLRLRGIHYHNTIELTGTSPIETQLHRALLTFYLQGARLEDLLELWPLLKAVGRTAVSVGTLRDVCSRLFDEKQTHALAAYEERLQSESRPEWREVAKIVALLLPPFSSETTIALALDRFSSLCAAFEISLPVSLSTLDVLAERETRLLPTGSVFSALLSFIPEGSSVLEAEKGNFARVTLLTRRRAEGLVFSHLILAEANAGVWPCRSEASPWLPDEYKEQLNLSSRFSLGVFTSEDRAALEKLSYAALARDTQREIIFTAAVFDEAQPETRLAANCWVERVFWSDASLRTADCDLEQIFAELAVSRAAPQPFAAPQLLAQWLEVWRSRRDPQKAFDHHFFCVDPQQIRPDVLSARLLERAVQDPAELWFGAILGVPRVEWRPFVRARKRAIGQWVHRVLAAALQTHPGEGVFSERLDLERVRVRLHGELEKVRENWPQNPYWDSFHLELARSCEMLLEAVYALPLGPFVATELALPWKATVPIGNGERLRVRGRVDVGWFDQLEWAGATVDIVDFKTGTDAALSSQRMANKGFALQLGVYLAAAESLGAISGKVWMLKPELNGFSSLEMSDLANALTPLNQIGRHLRTGIYGALTPDVSDYTPEGLIWPLACVPIDQETLEAKFAASFQAMSTEVPFE